MTPSHEKQRLEENEQRKSHWLRWGPYLSERQWATVREDYSSNGDCWSYFPHDHARSRAYRWGEDGLLGFTDSKCRLCLSVALWNEQDGILKERLFGLTNPEGNHGEDVKEQYFYLYSTPSHSYVKQLYKYPHAKFPYTDLVKENGHRSTGDPEYELLDTGIFNENRYMDVVAEYAKAGPDDILLRYTVTNHGPEAAPIHLIPQIWFRNNWTWQCNHEGCTAKPSIKLQDERSLALDHESLGKFRVVWDEDDSFQEALFTENVTNDRRILGSKTNRSRYVKDAFHRHVIDGEIDVVNPKQNGTKAGLHHRCVLVAGETRTFRLRLFNDQEPPSGDLFDSFDSVFSRRLQEGEAFYDQ
ncbi:MAG: MGH1-like glycoside hydrolase domain-containing protein, partial [Verrucomicrobiales bacterium]